MKPLKTTLVTPSGTTTHVWDLGFTSVYLDIGENGKRAEVKLKIQCDGRVFECDIDTGEVIKEQIGRASCRERV